MEKGYLDKHIPREHPKECLQLGGGKGLVTMRAKVDRGEGNGLAVSRHPFQSDLCKREEAFNGHCIIIFLC